jgi:hypothetical protein
MNSHNAKLIIIFLGNAQIMGHMAKFDQVYQYKNIHNG